MHREKKKKIYVPEDSAPKPKFRLPPFSSVTTESESTNEVPAPENRFRIPSLRLKAMASVSSVADVNRFVRSAMPSFSVVATLAATGGRAAN